jgi:hypothetical protein
LGGGGAELAALKDQTLKCVIALVPDDGKQMRLSSLLTLSFPEVVPTSVPVLIICGEKDDEASPKTNAWPHYRQTGATKLIFEVAGGDHYLGLGPAGGTKSELEAASEENALCFNFMIAYACMFMCPNACWCGPCPYGTLNAPSGHATDHAPRGAIGGVALAWLRLFLLGDENARSLLVNRPDIASGFEHSGVAGQMTMDG